MAKLQKKLSDREVKALGAELAEKKRGGRRADGGKGLYLEVKAADADQTKPGARKYRRPILAVP